MSGLEFTVLLNSISIVILGLAMIIRQIRDFYDD